MRVRTKWTMLTVIALAVIFTVGLLVLTAMVLKAGANPNTVYEKGVEVLGKAFPALPDISKGLPRIGE